MMKTESWVLRRWQIGAVCYFNMGRNCFDWHVLFSEPRKSTEVVLSPQWKGKFSLGSQKGRVDSSILLPCLTTSHKWQFLVNLQWKFKTFVVLMLKFLMSLIEVIYILIWLLIFSFIQIIVKNNNFESGYVCMHLCVCVSVHVTELG